MARKDNHQFNEVVQMIRKTDYIHRKESLNRDETVALAISLFKNNIGWEDLREHFRRFLGMDSSLSKEEIVASFKENFKKKPSHKLLWFLLTRQVDLGESNHTKNLTNRPFYVVMHSIYKDTTSTIEQAYSKKCQKQ
ncbi:hypothetical protein [Flagellimonas sp.]